MAGEWLPPESQYIFPISHILESKVLKKQSPWEEFLARELFEVAIFLLLS